MINEKFSQQEINKIDEIHTITKFKEQFQKEEGFLISNCKELKEDGKSIPDFKCITKNGKVIFIEVTKILSVDGNTLRKNKAYEKMEKELEQELKKAGFKDIDILINLN